MDPKQIAHDLTIAKLCSSPLPPDGMYKQYQEYVREFEIVLGLTEEPAETPVTPVKAKITDRSKLGI